MLEESSRRALGQEEFEPLKLVEILEKSENVVQELVDYERIVKEKCSAISLMKIMILEKVDAKKAAQILSKLSAYEILEIDQD